MKTRRAKTNPTGSTAEPWIARKIALISFRCRVRDILESHNERILPEIETMLGSFAPDFVRGDYVPTIADAYAEAVELANLQDRAGDCDAAASHVTVTPSLQPQVQTILTDAGAFRVEVRFVPVTSKKHNA